MSNFPYYLECYHLTARDGLPPHPEDEPAAKVVIRSKEDDLEARRKFSDEYPGSWVVESPYIDND
jgi:hypothetical protein